MRTSTRKNRKSSHFSPYFIKRLSSWLVLSTALTLACPSESHAATQVWNPGDATWDAATTPNWDAAAVWTNGNGALFNATGVAFQGVTIAAGGVTAASLQFDVAGYSVGGTGTLTLTGVSEITTNADATISAAIAGAGLLKDGTGVLTLSGLNTFGATVIGNGTLKLGSATAYPSGANLTLGLADANNATFDLNTFDATVNALSFNTTGGTKAITNSGGTLSTFTINNSVATNFGGLFSGTNLKVSETGSALLTLSVANSYGGGTSITGTGGVLITDLGALGSGAAAIGTGSQLDVNAVAGNLANAITLNGGTLRQSAGNTLTTQGLITVNSASVINVAPVNPGKIFVNAGITGAGNLAKNGNGILQIVQANAGYSGNWTINGGQVEAQAVGALGTGAVTINTGGELVASNVLVGNNVTIGGAGALLSFDNGNSGDFRGTINAAQNFSVVLKDFYSATGRSGVISGALSGSGNMSVSGVAATTTTVSSLLLSGNSPTYTGTITPATTAQLRAVQGATQDGLGAAAIVLGGTTLGIAPQLTAAGGTAGFKGSYYYGTALGTGVNFTHGINDGVIGGYDFGASGTGAVRVADGNRTDTTINFATFNSALPGGFVPAGGAAAPTLFGVLWTGVLSVATGGAYTFNTGSDDGSLLYVDGVPVVLNDFAQGVTTRSGSISLPSGFHSIVVKYGQGIGGSGINVNYSGPDTANVLTVMNSGVAAGTVTSNAGILFGAATTIDNNITLTAATTSAIDISGTTATSTGTLTFGAGANLNLTGLTGSESLTQQGNVTLNGINFIQVGPVQVNSNPGNYRNQSAGADLIISGAIGEAVAGSNLVKYGPRNVTLSGTNTFTGATYYTGGTLLSLSAAGGNAISGNITLTPIFITGVRLTAREFANDQVANTAVVTLTGFSGVAGADFDLNGFNDTIGGFNFINNQGASALTVSTGAGTLTLNGNVLATGVSTGAGTFTGNLNLGGATRTFTVQGIGGLLESALTTNGSITKAGLGTMTISGANPGYSGLTTISQGKLAITNAGALGTTATPGVDNTLVNSGGYLDIGALVVSEALTLNGKGQPIIGTTGAPAPTYTGALQASGAAITATESGNILLGSSSSIGVPKGTALTLSGIISDGVVSNAYSLTKTQGDGTASVTPTTLGTQGTLVLTGVNTYTGATTIEGGELRLQTVGQAIASTVVNIGNGSNNGAQLTLGASNQMPSTVVLNFNNTSQNAKFQLNGFNQTVKGFSADTGVNGIIQNFEAAGAGTSVLTVDTAGTNTAFNGRMRDQSGVLALTKAGAGTLTLSGINAQSGTNIIIYTGQTTINGGKLVLNDTLGFNSAIQDNVAGSAGLEFNINYGRTLGYTKLITETAATGAGFTKSGPGNLILNQALQFGGTGTIQVTGGSLVVQGAVGANTVLGATAATINVTAGGQLDLWGNGIGASATTYNPNITLNGVTVGGALLIGGVNASSDTTVSGILTLAGAGVFSNVSTGWSDHTGRITGKITGTGGLQIDKQNYTQQPLSLQISNVTNDYSGGTTINAGTIYFTGASLPSTGLLTLGGYSTASSQAFLSGTNLVLGTNGPTGFTRTVGTAAGNVAFAGEGGGFTALGSAQTVNFGGASGSVSWGGAGFSAGATFWFNNGVGLANGGGIVADNSVTVTNDLVFSGGGTRRVYVLDNNGTAADFVVFSGAISGTGGLIKDGFNATAAANQGTLRLNGAVANTFSGNTDVFAGVLALNKSASTNAIGGDLQIGGLQNNGSRRIVYLGANEQIPDSATVSFLGSSGNNGDLRLFGFNETVGAIQDRSGGGIIEIAEGGDTGFLGVAINNTLNSTLTVGGSTGSPVNTDSFYNGFMRNQSGGTGTLILVKNGTGKLTISQGQQSGAGSATYSGATTINAGTLQYSNIGTFNSAVTLATSSTSAIFDTNINQSLTDGAVISGAGNVQKIGIGTMILSGTNAYSGTTTVNAGTLQITGVQTAAHTGAYAVNSGGTLLIGNATTGGVLTNNNAVTVNSGGTLAFTRNAAFSFASVVTGAGNVENRTAGGLITLSSGSNAYTGTTTANAGTLTLNGTGASGGGLVMNTGGTIVVDFNQAGAPGTNIVAATAPVSLNGGTLTLSSISGGTSTQSLGTVTLNSTQYLGAAILNNGVPSILSAVEVGGGTMNGSFGSFVRNPGGALSVVLPTVGLFTTSSTPVGGILGGYATTSGGSTFVALSGSTLSALATYTSDTWDGTNIDATANSTQLGSVTANALRFNTGTTFTVTLSGSNTITSGGILMTTATPGTGETITGGTLQTGAGQDLTVTQNNNNGGFLTINSNIIDNGSSTALTKVGGGVLRLAGTNTYAGGTFILGGRVQNVGSMGSGAVTLYVGATNNAGATLEIGDGTLNGVIPTINPVLGTVNNPIATVSINNGAAQSFAVPFNANSNFNFITNAALNGTSYQTGIFSKSGAGVLTITAPVVANQFHQRAGTTVLDTGANVVVSGFNSVGLLGGDVATLTVKGVGKITESTDFNVGDSSGTGTLNIQGQGVAVVGNLFVGKFNTAVGVVNQTFGSVSNTGGAIDWRIGGYDVPGSNTGAYGIYNLSAGTFQVGKNFQIGASGLGVFNQTGGTASVTGGFNVISRYNGSGALNVSGGTYTDTTANNMIVAEYGTGVLNVGIVGGTTLVPYSAGQVLMTNTAAGIGVASNNGGVGTGSVNLIYGGLLSTAFVIDQNLTNSVANSPSYLNFHGGILQGRAASTAALPFLGGYRAVSTNASTNFNTTLTAATVWSEGALIDTNTFALSLPQTLLAPTGSGVSAIATGVGGSGYLGEPIVSFTGGTLAAGGSPATARAVVSGGVITGYVITNPGSYTVVPTGITLAGGGGAGATPGALTTPANATTGGLTKLAAGVLTMTSTGGVTTGATIGTPNTYLGATTVNGGTLLEDYSAWNTTAPTNMINAASVLQLGGGTLSVQGKATVAASALLTGTGTSLGNTILLSAAPAGYTVGQTITGTGVAAGAVVTSINGTTITVSAAHTGAVSGTMSVGALTATAASQAFASTTLNAGGNAINALLNSGAGVTITLGAITRNAGSAVDFALPATGSITTTLLNTGTTILGGWATVNSGANWAVTSTVAGTNPVTALGSYVNDTWLAGNNTTVTLAANALATTLTTNSLRFNTAAADTVTITGTNTLTTGGILVTPTVAAFASTLTGGTIVTGGSNTDLVVNQFNTNAAGTMTITSAIGANGTGGLVKAGGGVLILNSPTTTNVYAGATTIGAGSLKIGVTEQIPNGSTVTISAGATLDLNNLGETINGLSGYGNVVNTTAGTPTLTVGSSGASSTFSGILVNGTGNVALNKTGAGTLTLNNVAAGSFTGGTTISAGAIDIATPNALANNTTITVSATNGLLFDTTIPTISGLQGASNFALTTTGTAPVPSAPVQLSVGNNNAGSTGNTPIAYSGALTGTGTLIKIGTGVQTLSGANTNSGGLIVNAGLLVLSGNNSGASGLMVANSGGTFQFNAANSLVGAAGRNLLVATGGVVTLGTTTANPTSTGFGTVSSVFSRIDQGSTGILGLQIDGSLQTAVSENLDFSAAGLNLSLGATLNAISTLSTGTSNVQYTGVITPNANVFRLGGGGGRLILPNSATMAGANSLFLYGGGTAGGNERLYLTGAYGFTGGTTVTAGTTLINTLADAGSASSLGAGAAAASNLVLNAGTLQYIGSGSSTNRLFTISAGPTTIDSSGTGPVNFTGTGAVAFLNSGARTWTVQGNNTGANTIALAIGDSVNVAGAGGVLATALTTFQKNGNGTWFLSGANTFSGGVTINNGVLGFNSAGAFGGNTVNGVATVTVNANGAAALGGSLTSGIQASLNRISPFSTGTVALTADTSENISFDGGSAGTNLPTAFLGAYGSVSYSGTLTPFANTYRLGGGGGVLTIAGGGLTGPRAVLIGGGGPGTSFVNNPNLNGAVVLGGTSDYAGGTQLLAGGIVSATSLTALGTGPLKFQGGVYRAVNATDISLASDGVTARDIRIGADTANAAGTALIDVVAGVNLVLSKPFGTLPTYGANQGQDTLTKYGAGTLTLSGLNLTLAAALTPTNSGLLTIERGTVSFASNPTFYVGNIQVGSNAGGVGSLKLGADNVFGTGTVALAGSIIDVYGGSSIDVNGKIDSIRNVRGMGGIIDTHVGAPTGNLTVGTNSEVEILGGNLVGNFTLTVGGNQTNTIGSSGNVVGLELWNNNSTGFTGKLVANAGALRLRADGSIGSPTEAFQADRITLNNGAVLTTGTAAFVPLVIGANHGITLGSTGGTIAAPGTNPLIINSPITGSGMLNIGDETGTVFLAGTNTYTGGTTINSASTRGYLSIGAGGATGTLPAGDFLFNSASGGGRLYFFRSTDMTVANNINGPGFLLQIGGGTTTLTGNNTTFQSVFVGGGRLKADFSGANAPISTGSTPSVSAGTFEYVGSSGDNIFRLGQLTATSFGMPNSFNGGGFGDAAVQSTYVGTGIQQLIFNGNTRGTTGVTMNFITSGGTNGVSNSIMFEQGPALKNAIHPAYFFNGSDFAALDPAGFVRAADYGNDYNTNALNSLATAGRYSKLTTSITGQAAVAMTAINLSGAGTNLTMSAAAALTMNGNPGTILKSGTGTSVIGGGAGATVNNNGQELILRTDTATDILQIDVPIAGGGPLTKSGLGQLTLTAANTYTGSTFINSGSVLVTTNGVLGTNTGGANIRLANAAGTTVTLTMDSSASSIVTGGNGGDSLRIGEAGTATFTQSAGTVTGNQFVTIGDNLGSVGTYNMSGGTLSVKNNNANTPALVVGRAGTGTFNISGTAAVSVKSGAQVLLGSGIVTSTAVTYQGSTPNTGLSTGVGTITQTGGSLTVDTNNGAYQSQVYGAVILGLDGSGTYNLNGGTLTTPMIGRGHGTASFNLGGGTLKAPTAVATLPSVFNVDLPINLTGTGAGKGTIDTNGNDVALTGALSGVGGLTKASAGALTVLGAGSYADGTNITGGSVVASGTSLGTGIVNVGASGTLAVQGLQKGLLAKFTVGALTQVTPGVTTGNAAMMTELSSYANFNAYMAGKPMLAVESTAARGKVSVNYLEDGVPNGTTAIPPAIVALNNGNNQFTASLAGKFNAALAGDYTFQTRSDDASAMWVDGLPVLDNNRGQSVTTRTGTITLTAGLHDITIAWANTGGGQGFSAGVTLPGQGQSFTIGNELNMSNDLLSFGSDTLTISGLTGSGTAALGTGTLEINGTGSNNFSGGLTGSGAGCFLITGAGTQTLSGNNNAFTAGYCLNGGILSVASAAALGTTGPISFGGGTLQHTASNAADYSARFVTTAGQLYKVDTNSQTVTWATNLVSAGGTLTKLGLGTLILPGVNTYTGATTITAGTLQVDGSTAAASTVGVGTAGTLSGSGSVFGNATLTGSGIINFTNPGVIAGTLGVTGGNWNGAGSVTGLVTSSSGNLNIGAGANLTANGNLNVTGGTFSASNATTSILTGSLNYTSSTGSTFIGVIAGGGKTVTMNSAATTLALTGVNTYTGLTSITNGTLSINADTALGIGGGVAFSNNAVLKATGTVTDARAITLGTGGTINTNGNPVTLNTGGSVTGGAGVALTHTGAGNLDIKGTQSYDILNANGGLTTLDSALGTGTSTLNANATTQINVSQTLSVLNIADGVEVTFGTGLPFAGAPEKSGGFTAAFTPPIGGAAIGGSAVVPEPGSVGLLLVGALGLLGRRRRSRSAH